MIAMAVVEVELDERTRGLLQRYARLRAAGKTLSAEGQAKVEALLASVGLDESDLDAWLAGDGAGSDGGSWDEYGEGTERDAQKELMRRKRAPGREVKIPPPKDPERRSRASVNLRAFIHSYFPHLTYIEDGQFQIEVTEILERLIKYGGMRAIAGPRGYAKDMLTNLGCIWGILNGYLKFPIVVRSDQPESIAHLDIIKRELESNDTLAEDYPEVCGPIRKIAGVSQRARALTYKGRSLGMEWNTEAIALPNLEEYPCAGARIETTGVLTGGRGTQRGGGEGGRPDFLLISDPETERSVWSTATTNHIHRVITNNLIGMAGPGTTMSGVILCTLMRKKCLAARYTDPETSPQFNGVRYKALLKEPHRSDLWERYIYLWRQGPLKGDPDSREAHRFYIDNREDMEAGAEVLWPANYDRTLLADGTPREISNLQHLYNKKASNGEDYFLTELQNEPPDEDDQVLELSPDDIVRRVNELPERVVPDWAEYLVEGIDVGAREIHYVVAAFSPSGSGAIVDYGIEQTHLPSDVSFSPKTGQLTGEVRQSAEYGLMEALRHRRDTVRAEPYRRANGAEVPLNVSTVDAGWMTSVIHQFCKESGNKYRPVMGFGKGQPNGAFRERQKNSDDVKVYRHYYALRQRKHKSTLWCLNADYYKQYTHDRFAQAMDTEGAVTLYGESPALHVRFAKHICAEHFDLEKQRWIRDSQHNHYLDAMAYCCAAGDMCGVRLLQQQGEGPKARVRPAPKPMAGRPGARSVRDRRKGFRR